MTPRFALLFIASIFASTTHCQAAEVLGILPFPPIVAHTFNIELSNGTATEMSPAVAYTTAGAQSASPIGSAPTPGFVELCLNGPTAERAKELAGNPNVQQSLDLATAPHNFGLLEPGQSESFQLTMVGEAAVHVEMMYGKTKDVCSVITIPRETLTALVNTSTTDAVGGDQVVATGAYLDPALPSASTSAATACRGQSSARSCLRALAATNSGAQKVRAFPGYLPSVLNALEQVYGAAAAQQIIIPTAGGIQYRITLVGTTIL